MLRVDGRSERLGNYVEVSANQALRRVGRPSMRMPPPAFKVLVYAFEICYIQEERRQGARNAGQEYWDGSRALGEVEVGVRRL